MHEQRTRRGGFHELWVYLVGRENLLAAIGLTLLSHRRPDVGIDRVNAAHCLAWVVEQSQFGAVARRAGGGFDDLRRKLVAARRGDVKRQAEQRRGVRQGCRDVVAVADKRDTAAAHRSPALLP